MWLKEIVVFATLALALAQIGAVAQTVEPAEQPVGTEVAAATQTPVIASGGPAGVYYPIANILGDAAGGDFEILSTTGSMENLVRLALGEVDFAIALSDRVGQAMAGESPFDHGGLGENLRLVMALFPEPLTILVRADDDIRTLSDLEGRAVNLGEAGNPTGRLFRLTLDASEQVHEEENFRDVPLAEQADALCAGDVDAIAYLAAHPSGTVHQVASLCDVRILPIDGETADILLASDATLVPARIPAALYPGNSGRVDSVGPMALLVTRSDVSPMFVDRLVNGVMDDPAAIERRHPVLAVLDQYLPLVENGPAPLHERAAALLVDLPTQ